MMERRSLRDKKLGTMRPVSYRFSNRNADIPSSERFSLPGPDDITRRQLPNGIVVLVRENHNSPTVVVSGYLQVGALFDPREKLGLSDFTSASLMRGTQKRDFRQVFDALESVGASLGFSGATHTTGFNGKALAEDLDLILELFGEALRYPAFPPEQVERLRAQLLTNLAIRAQSTGDMAALTFDQMVYAGHPYSLPVDGYPETIQAITRDDLLHFHQHHYGPQGMVITIVGAVDPGRAIEKVANTLADWQNPLQPQLPDLPEVCPLEKSITRTVTMPGKVQADVLMGSVGPSRRDPDYMAAALGNSILGRFGMMGRIGEAVREKAGLAYYAHSSLSGGMGPGPWVVAAGVDPHNIDQAIHLIQQEISRFTGQTVSVEELQDSQANFIGSLPLSLESNWGVAGALLRQERYGLGLDYYWRYADQIRAVTVEDILATANRFLDPDKLGIAIASP